MFFNGRRIQGWMKRRTDDISEAAKPLKDPDVSIVIRSRNDGPYIRQLLADIQAQIFDGAIEVILVDTESRDDTVAYARSQGARVMSLTQEAFTYPKALNLGFQAARYPWLVTLVGHSSLTSRLFLKQLTYWSEHEKKLGGIYGLPLANWNASRWERLTHIIAPHVWKQPRVIDALSIGIMGANCSIVRRAAWERLGGYDERYAAGGEDRAFAASMLAKAIPIIREPLCSVFHSHGLNMQHSIKQWLHWGEVAKSAAPFETKKVHNRRPDLR